MKIDPILGFALLFCVAGCSSVKTSSLHCSSLSCEEQGLIHSDLNRMLVGDGFTAASASEVPWGMAWSNDSFSPLWTGRAYFQVGAAMNPTGMDIDVCYYRGAVSANNALVDAIVACVQHDAPSSKVKIEAKAGYSPSYFKE
ncbi:MAG: hypothetical protein ABSE48_22705 [Verrucomicrobiota bacterium]|jgi:hypothetical protein